MIEAIPGWTCEQRASGYVLIPPEGEAAGGIRYQERLRPLRRMRELVTELPVPAGYQVIAVGEIEPVITVEGEYGALVVIDGALDGEPLQRTIGAVFCDDWYSLVIGVARRADQYARIHHEVRRLVRHDTHMLGVRRRRFVHAAPPGWQGFLAGAMHGQWVPPEYPRDPRSLVVFPAMPAGAGGHVDAGGVLSLLADRFGATAELGVGDALLVCTRSGLSGHWWTLEARGTAELLHDLVVLEDGRYVYPILMTSPAIRRADHVEVLRGVVDSIEPIPPATVIEGARHTAVFDWID